MADNGGLAISGRMGNKESNYPLSFGKGSNREGGIREPMIVLARRHQGGKRLHHARYH